jgi:hypothetical protein
MELLQKQQEGDENCVIGRLIVLYIFFTTYVLSDQTKKNEMVERGGGVGEACSHITRRKR